MEAPWVLGALARNLERVWQSPLGLWASETLSDPCQS